MYHVSQNLDRYFEGINYFPENEMISFSIDFDYDEELERILEDDV